MPSGGEVAQLVEQGVITKEEAKDLLFNESKNNDDVEQLKKQIEFLEGIVKELSKNRPQTVFVDRYVREWEYKLPRVWISTAMSTTTGAVGSAVSATNLTNYSQGLLK